VAFRSRQLPAGPAPRRPSWVARARARLRARIWPGRSERGVDLSASVAAVLDLFEEHFYVGDITPDGRYVAVVASPTLERLFGGPVPPGAEPGALWESMIHADDWPGYVRFNRSLLGGQDADATYRVTGLDGVMRTFRDRARPVRGADGGVRVHGILSDITFSAEADARAAEAGERFTSLLDVVGEHVYLAMAHADGRIEELFQGPGADRLLGGAEPDPEMVNWEAALHPDDREAYDAFNRELGAGRKADVEYRLRGADGITRWVHDRAATRRRPDGTVEISGIVSDVTEQRQMRLDLAAAHAAVSRVVEAMDDHLYTLQVLPDGTSTPVYRGPHREALIGGPLPGGADDDALWASLLHPDDRERWAAALRRLPAGEPVELEYRVTGLDGVERILHDRLRPRWAADGVLFFDGVTRDVTERRRLEEQLELLARTDELTGTYNRRHFTELVTAERTLDATSCALLLLDADHFKQINDVHGHAAGDAVLVELARRLAAELAPDELLARWGGEEFALLLRRIDSDGALRRRAERLCDVVRATPMLCAGTTIHITVSIGAARHGAGSVALDAWIESADHALYAAKGRGRDRVCLASEVRSERTRPFDSEALMLARATALRADQGEVHARRMAGLADLVAEQLGLPPGVVASVVRALLAATGESTAPRRDAA
jgi:diguanylate cyclase (GGDEF)-like protein